VGLRDERIRHLTIFLVAAPSAAIVWAIFHAVYENLSATAKAIGYVDSLTQVLIGLGYVAMVGGTLVLGAIAAWAGIAYLLLLRRDR
jgi:hypothetical protein